MDLIGSVGRLYDSLAQRKARQDRVQPGQKKTENALTGKPVEPASSRAPSGNERQIGKNVDISV